MDAGAWPWVFGVIGLILNAIATIFLVIQIKRAKHAFEQEQRRLKRQSTLEFIAATMDRAADLAAVIPRHNDIAASLVFIETARTSLEARRAWAQYFSYYESLAAGCNCNVFDIEVIYRTRGTTIIRMEQLFHDFVVERRTASRHHEMYREIEQLVKTLLEYERSSGRPTSLFQDSEIAAIAAGIESAQS